MYGKYCTCIIQLEQVPDTCNIWHYYFNFSKYRNSENYKIPIKTSQFKLLLVFFSFCEICFVQVLIEKIRKDQEPLNFLLNI